LIGKEEEMLCKSRNPLLAVFIVLYLLFLSGAPSMAGMIGPVTSPGHTGHDIQQFELNHIQRALENEVVKAKLEAYGLTPDEIQTRLHDLSDEQIHLLAQASDNILAGGDGGEVLVAVLLIILIVILIVYLTGHQVIVK
jgi:hypothetical protein